MKDHSKLVIWNNCVQLFHWKAWFKSLLDFLHVSLGILVTGRPGHFVKYNWLLFKVAPQKHQLHNGTHNTFCSYLDTNELLVAISENEDLRLVFLYVQSLGTYFTHRLWKFKPQYSHFKPCLNMPAIEYSMQPINKNTERMCNWICIWW